MFLSKPFFTTNSPQLPHRYTFHQKPLHFDREDLNFEFWGILQCIGTNTCTEPGFEPEKNYYIIDNMLAFVVIVTIARLCIPFS